MSRVACLVAIVLVLAGCGEGAAPVVDAATADGAGGAGGGGGSGGADGGSDAKEAGVVLGGACGTTTCGADETCATPCCGGAPPLPGQPPCTPPPPYCVKATDCRGQSSNLCCGGCCGYVDKGRLVCTCA
jgi:hypothetical protein